MSASALPGGSSPSPKMGIKGTVLNFNPQLTADGSLPLTDEELIGHLLRSVSKLSDAVEDLRGSLAARDARAGFAHATAAWQWSVAIYQVYWLYVGLVDQLAGKGASDAAK